MDQFNYSPDEYHRQLAGEIQPAMGFQGGDVIHWQKQLRSKLQELIGAFPDKHVPLNVRRHWHKNHPLGSIEKITFTSEPYADVPAYVCLPKDKKPPYTFFICLQGHIYGMHASIGVSKKNEHKPMKVKKNLDLALGCMSRGFAALCLEMRSMGERLEQHKKRNFLLRGNFCQEAAMHALMLGKTLLGERVYDVKRGIEYLKSREDADMEHIGILGNSGGGAVALYSSALLKSIKYTLASCCFAPFNESIMRIRHCVDNYIPGVLTIADMPDIVGLHAPNPLVIVGATRDRLFPGAASKLAFEHVRKIYRAFGAEHNGVFILEEGDHQFYPQQAWEKMNSLVIQDS